MGGGARCATRRLFDEPDEASLVPRRRIRTRTDLRSAARGPPLQSPLPDGQLWIRRRRGAHRRWRRRVSAWSRSFIGPTSSRSSSTRNVKLAAPSGTLNRTVAVESKGAFLSTPGARCSDDQRRPRGATLTVAYRVHRVVPGANLEAYRRHLPHAVILAFEETIEETRLQRQGVWRVVRRPLATAVRVEKAMARADTPERLEAAARVQSLVREAAADERRNLDALEIRGARRPELVPLRMGDLPCAERFGDAAGALRHVRPEGDESVFANSARVCDVAVGIGPPLPRTDGNEVLRAQRGDLPLADRKIRHAVQADPAIGPRLRGRPLDRLGVVGCLLVRKQCSDAVGGAEPAEIDVDHRVPPRYPEARVGRLPARIDRVRDGIGLPDEAIACEGQGPERRTSGEHILAVRVRAHHRGKAAVVVGAKHVRAQRRAVAHGNFDVALEAYAPRRGRNRYLRRRSDDALSGIPEIRRRQFHGGLDERDLAEGRRRRASPPAQSAASIVTPGVAERQMDGPHVEPLEPELAPHKPAGPWVARCLRCRRISNRS